MAHVFFQMVRDDTEEVGFGTATGQTSDGLHIRITVAVYDPGMSKEAYWVKRRQLSLISHSEDGIQ